MALRRKKMALQEMIGKKYVVWTYSAGLHVGTLVRVLRGRGQGRVGKTA
jgi:hypothetical protein